jgi:hypothetical protein
LDDFEEFDDSETESCDSDDGEDSDSDVSKYCEDSKFPGCFVESKDDCDFSVYLTQFQLTRFSDDPCLVFRQIPFGQSFAILGKECGMLPLFSFQVNKKQNIPFNVKLFNFVP